MILSILADLIPFFISVALLVVALFIPPLNRSTGALAAYMVVVYIVSIGVHLIWLGGN